MYHVDSQEQFFRTERNKVVSFVRLQGFTLQESEDAAHEAFIDVFVRWDDVTHRRAYVRTAALRVAVRARKRDRRLLSRYTEALSRVSRLRQDAQDMKRVEDRELLVTLFRQLTPRQRQVLALAMDDFSDEEIAAGLRMKGATVRSTKSTAKERLRALNPADGEVDDHG